MTNGDSEGQIFLSISSGSILFAKTKMIFRGKNTIIWKFQPVTAQYIQQTIPKEESFGIST